MWSNWLPVLTAARVTRWALFVVMPSTSSNPQTASSQTGSDIFVASAVPTSACFQSQKADRPGEAPLARSFWPKANARHSMPRMARMPNRRFVRRSWKIVASTWMSKVAAPHATSRKPPMPRRSTKCSRNAAMHGTAFMPLRIMNHDSQVSISPAIHGP